MRFFILILILGLVVLGLALALWLLQLQQPGSGPAGEAEPELEPGVYMVVQTGSFAIAQLGTGLGEEGFSLQRSPQGALRLVSTVRLEVRGVELQMDQELRLAGDLRPLFYRLKARTPQGPQMVTVSFHDQQAELRARGGGLSLTKEFAAVDRFVVMDNNVPSQLLVLCDLLKQKEHFTATALIPQALVAVPLKAERAQPVKLWLDGRTVVAERFLVRLGDVRFEIYVVEGRLIGGQFPGQVQIYRDDLYPGGFEVLEELSGRPKSRELPPWVREEEVSFAGGGAGVVLAGSLVLPVQTVPARPFPAVLLIAGSGPVDRDENSPGLQTDIFNTLAYRLAREGIASLRYDKRGVGASSGEFRKASLNDLVADARAALDYLRGRPEIDPNRVFLLGHSEGGVIAPMLAVEEARAGVRVAGLILIAAPAHPLDWIILKQIERIDRSLGLPEEQIAQDLEREQRFIAFVKASEGDWDDYTLEEVRRWIPGLTELEFEAYKAISLRWYREHFAHDPLETIAQVEVPVLIIHGEKDIQVPVEEAERLAQALQEAGNEAVKLQILPDLNHLLRRHPEEPSIAYRHLGEPVDPRVLGAIAEWLAGVSQPQQSAVRAEALRS